MARPPKVPKLPEVNIPDAEPLEDGTQHGDELSQALELEVAPGAGVSAKEMRKGRAKGAKGVKRFTLPDALKVANELRLTRLKAVRAKRNLTGDEAVEWGKQRLQDLVPEAVADLQFALRFGSTKERADARERILKANGLADKEAPQGQGGTVILNLGGNLEDAPFLKRALDTSPSAPTLTDEAGNTSDGNDDETV